MALRQWMTAAVEDIRASYWFLPTLLAFAGLALGLALVLVDARLGDAWLGSYEWFYGSRPEGARAMLSTIAGSTITVAGVVFSITLAAVTYASGQFGPRLLGNFMRDRGNQATLGIFIGTYLYCLVVLRTIRNAEQTNANTAAMRDAFVPHLAMFGGLALAIASTAVLIYFVHHVTNGIHINNVIARVGRDLIADIREQGDDSSVVTGPQAPLGDQFTPIFATKTGYIEAIDYDALLAIACRRNIVLRPIRRAGDFVSEGSPLLHAYARESVSPGGIEHCADTVTIGRLRTAQQDLRFAIDELVEIAARALSPGVNDPFTAIACIDWLGAALTEIDRSPPPPDRMSDRDGTVRIILQPLRFDDFLTAAFGQLRSYIAADPNARAHALATLTQLAADARRGRHRTLIQAEHARLAEMASGIDA